MTSKRQNAPDWTPEDERALNNELPPKASKTHSTPADVEAAFGVLEKKHHPTWEIECVQATAELRAHFHRLEEQHDALRRAIEEMGDHVVALEGIGKRALGV